MADTELQQLVVWVGTTEKIEEARAQGLITENDFAITTDAPEFQTKLTSANAGTGISITEVGGVVKISNTQTSAEWGNIQGSIQTQTDLWNYLSQIGVLSNLSTTVKTDLVSAINEVYGIADTALQPSDIINTTDSTATNKALSANMGKELQDQIDNLSARGRFLALWNCATGLAQSNPPESPYIYKTGDYFIVGTVASAGGTNYRPNGATYTTGVSSTTVETAEVSVDDVYYYDGTNWRLQSNTQKILSFANIAGDPYDNTNLAATLDSKLEGVQIDGTELTPDANNKVNIPIAANNRLGVVFPAGFGVIVTASGALAINRASDALIDAKTNNFQPVVPSNLDYAVKVGVTTNTNTLTDTEKQNACKWVGAVSGVQINGTDLTPDATTNKVNIPYASTSAHGVVKIVSTYGIGSNANGQIYIMNPTDTQIETRSGFIAITCSKIDKAVMEGLGNNFLTWTDAYKTSARNTIGATRVSFVDWTD